MSTSLRMALPEDLLTVPTQTDAGIPIDAITCAVERANAVLLLLEDKFECDTPRLASNVIAAALWDVRGTLGLIRTLAIHADESSRRSVSGGAQ